MIKINYNQQEYESLREEIIKRIELRQQLVTLCVTSAGIIMGFGIQNTTLALLFPPLSLFITLMWAQNDLRALQISDYLTRIENEENKLGWISFYKNVQKSGSFRPGIAISVFAPGGMFVIIAIMTLGIGISSWTFNRLDIILIDIDVVSIGIMIWLVWKTNSMRIIRRTNEILLKEQQQING